MSVCQEFGVEGTKMNAVLDTVSWVLHILSTGRDLAAEGEAEACRAARSLTSRVCRWSIGSLDLTLRSHIFSYL